MIPDPCRPQEKETLGSRVSESARSGRKTHQNREASQLTVGMTSFVRTTERAPRCQASCGEACRFSDKSLSDLTMGRIAFPKTSPVMWPSPINLAKTRSLSSWMAWISRPVHASGGRWSSCGFRNIQARSPLVRHLEGDLWELREETQTNNYRIIYVFLSERRIVLLHRFQKKTQKTPTRKLETARRRYREFVERGNWGKHERSSKAPNRTAGL
jgi:hypothetical protein